MFIRNVGAGLAPALNSPALNSPALNSPALNSLALIIPAIKISTFHENTNSHALLNIEYILIFRAIGSVFMLFLIAVQIKDIDFIETL
jgi:hypothetical protein